MSDTFKIKIGGEDHEVKMTFGMLHVITAIVGDIDDIPQMSYNPELRTALLVNLLSDRDEKGEIIEEVSLWNLDADEVEIIELLDWAGAHVADFFLKSLAKTKTLLENRQDDLKALQQLSNGGAS